MKFYPNNFAQILELIANGKIKSILFYGPNRGLINILIEKIIEKTNLIKVNHSLKELSAEKLLTILNSQNLFGDREIIKITDIGTGFSKDYKNIFLNHHLHNFSCFIGDDSLPASGIRKFFEDQPDLASLACYYETPQNIGKLISQQCRKRGIAIDEDALFYLTSHLKGDHQIIKSELEKIFCYVHDKQKIDINDLQEALSSDLMASGDQMCIYFAKKEYYKFIEEANKLEQQNVNQVLMVRALIRYFINIYYVNNLIENNVSVDMAIKKLPSPIFYKYIDDFKRIIRQYNSQDAMRIIELLCDCEVKFKTKPNDFYLFEALLKISSEKI